MTSRKAPSAPAAENDGPSVGGQAVVEGVMMRAPGATSVAVRRPDGSLIVRVRRAKRVAEAIPLLSKPTLRGVAILVETMMDGISALNFSAENAMPEDERGKSGGNKPLTTAAIVATMAVSMTFGFFMFAILPHLLTWGLGMLLSSESLSGGRDVVFHLVDGVMKLAIFLLFVWTMSKMKDMRRVFEYHGAEHQAVHASEARVELLPQNIAKFPKEHARCGTAFLVTVIAVSILVFAGVFPLLPVLSENRLVNQILYVVIKLPLILPISGLSYEIIRFAGRQSRSWFGRIVSGPGVMVQHITTQQPDDSQREVSAVALRAALNADVFLGQSSEEIRTFDDFAVYIAFETAGGNR